LQPIIILLLILNSNLFGQSNSNKIIAKVGEEEITVDEFKKRFELVPQINQPGKSKEARKAELLYTIIAEKLWAQEAERLGLDTTNVMQYTFENLKKMYTRDALYKNEIEDKINIDEEKVRKVLFRSRKKLNLQFLKSSSQNEADSLYQLLQNGEDFTSLLKRWDSSFGVDSLFTISYGDFPEAIEDELYSLKISEYSKPIEASNGWYIFNLTSIDEIPFADEKAVSKEYLDLKKNLEQTIADELNRNYYGKLLGNKSVTTDGYLFWTFSDKIISSIKTDKRARGYS
jgi:parvulin-like peptidyl-prolyl isomerase